MSAVRAGAAYVELFVKGGKFNHGMKNASAKLKSFGRGVGMVGKATMAAGGAVVAPLIGAAKVFANTGDNVHKMAQRTGMSTEALSTMGFAAQQSGSDLNTLESGIKGMQRSLLNAATGSKESVDSLAALGMTIDDLEGLNPEDQLKRLADGLSQVDDPSKRAALAMRLFGKSGQQLLPMLNGGAKGIAALQAEADKLGLSINQEDANSAAELTDAWNRLKQTMMGVALTAGAAVAPALTQLSNSVADIMTTAIGWAKQNKTLIATVLGVGTAIVIAGSAVMGLGIAISTVGVLLGVAASALSIIGTVAAAIFTPIGLVVAAVLALGGYLIYASGAGTAAMDILRQAFDSIKTDALAAFGGIASALNRGDIAAAGDVLWSMLKLQWAKGTGYLKQTWATFTFSIAEMFIDAGSSLSDAWSSTMGFLGDAWAVFATGVSKLWSSTVGYLKKTWVKLKALFDDDINVEAEVKRIDGETKATNDEKDKIRNQGINARADATAKRKQETAARKAAIKNALGSMSGATTDALQADVDAARAKFDASVTAAKGDESSTVADTKPTPKPTPPPEIKAPEIKGPGTEFKAPEIELPETTLAELPDLELSSDATRSIDDFGDDLNENETLTAGFDTAGMAFGGDARMLDDITQAADAMAVEPELEPEVMNVPGFPKTNPTMDPAAANQMADLAAAAYSASNPGALSKTLSTPDAPSVASANTEKPKATNNSMDEIAQNTRELVTLARKGRLVFT